MRYQGMWYFYYFYFRTDILRTAVISALGVVGVQEWPVAAPAALAVLRSRHQRPDIIT